MRASDTADLEVSIVSLGDTELLAACVSSLAAACEDLAWRLAIVDNSTGGQDLEAVLALAPCASALRSEGPRGFGANHNLVLARILNETRARYVLVLNDDTELDPRAVTKLVDFADRNPVVGAVTPRIRGVDGRHEPSRLAWPSLRQEVARTAFPRLNPQPDAPGGWLNGACILFRATALRQVGCFDESFFLFFEDTDVCLRLERAGWELDVCVAASIVHLRHRTILEPERRPEIEEQVLRSRYLFFRKHHGPIVARGVTLFVRCALMARAAKMLAEAAAGRGPSGFSRARTLWALTRSRPTQPSKLELEARPQGLP